ncbi:hypothetical protein ABIE85_000924 [Bradyrhizobium diazoefficiens]|uniref:hypothetical protein n=1 Tax=Bradyrhizobium diazoefficiens TaxID=1355477 RepID=UPI0035153DD5
MYTLNFPIRLPDEHTFFDGGQFPVPALPGGLSFGCISYEKAPVVLQIGGFAIEQDAIDFCAPLRTALRVAALGSDHSITPSDAACVTSSEKHFNGNVPTVTPTEIKALPYHASASSQNGQHISALSKLIGSSLAPSRLNKVNTKPELALALELYSDCQFAGERHAQFIVLMTTLEILVPNANSKGKRGAVLGLVKDTLAKTGHPNPKSVGKQLDDLYVARNALIHEGKPVTDIQLNELRELVRSTLQALVA